MAKPRVFVSSTYYDLRYIRENLKSFIETLGYESVLFESGDIPFRHDRPTDDSCYNEIGHCHMLVLIIGGRYGSRASRDVACETPGMDNGDEKYDSVTRREYETARDWDIPIFIFVDAKVLTEYYTYKENRDNSTVKYAHVDSVNVFGLLDEILSQKRNSFVRGFENSDEITAWLREQWAGLFADFLSRDTHEAGLRSLTAQLADLSGVTSALKEYSESILRKVVPKESAQIISTETRKLSATRLQRFAREPVIEALARQPGKLTPQQLLTELQSSKSLEEFLQKAQVDDDEIQAFLADHEIPARRSFAELQLRYLVSSEPEEGTSEETS
jgi:hypothetical protein